MTLRTLNYGKYGIFLKMGNAGFCPSTVGNPKQEGFGSVWVFFGAPGFGRLWAQGA